MTKRWINRQKKDYFVNEAKRLGYASRAAFKFEQLQAKYHLISKDMTVIELGAAPGGWSQVIAKILGKNGHLIAVDLLALESDILDKLKSACNFEFIQGDFTEDLVKNKLIELIGRTQNTKISLVISDLAPNLTGIRERDQAIVLELAESVLDFCSKILSPGGGLLLKMFEGVGTSEYVKLLKDYFAKVNRVKPQASRAESREFYLIARDFAS